MGERIYLYSSEDKNQYQIVEARKEKVVKNGNHNFSKLGKTPINRTDDLLWRIRQFACAAISTLGYVFIATYFIPSYRKFVSTSWDNATTGIENLSVYLIQSEGQEMVIEVFESNIQQVENFRTDDLPKDDKELPNGENPPNLYPNSDNNIIKDDDFNDDFTPTYPNKLPNRRLLDEYEDTDSETGFTPKKSPPKNRTKSDENPQSRQETSQNSPRSNGQINSPPQETNEIEVISNPTTPKTSPRKIEGIVQPIIQPQLQPTNFGPQQPTPLKSKFKDDDMIIGSKPESDKRGRRLTENHQGFPISRTSSEGGKAQPSRKSIFDSYNEANTRQNQSTGSFQRPPIENKQNSQHSITPINTPLKQSTNTITNTSSIKDENDILEEQLKEAEKVFRIELTKLFKNDLAFLLTNNEDDEDTLMKIDDKIDNNPDTYNTDLIEELRTLYDHKSKKYIINNKDRLKEIEENLVTNV